MSDKKIAELQAEIDRLEAEKEKRVKLLADPKRQEIRRLWEQVLSGIEKLDALDEGIEGGEGGAFELVGKTFRINYDGELVES